MRRSRGRQKDHCCNRSAEQGPGTEQLFSISFGIPILRISLCLSAMIHFSAPPPNHADSDLHSKSMMVLPMHFCFFFSSIICHLSAHLHFSSGCWLTGLLWIITKCIHSSAGPICYNSSPWRAVWLISIPSRVLHLPVRGLYYITHYSLGSALCC